MVHIMCEKNISTKHTSNFSYTIAQNITVCKNYSRTSYIKNILSITNTQPVSNKLSYSVYNIRHCTAILKLLYYIGLLYFPTERSVKKKKTEYT